MHAKWTPHSPLIIVSPPRLTDVEAGRKKRALPSQAREAAAPIYRAREVGSGAEEEEGGMQLHSRPLAAPPHAEGGSKTKVGVGFRDDGGMSRRDA